MLTLVDFDFLEKLDFLQIIHLIEPIVGATSNVHFFSRHRSFPLIVATTHRIGQVESKTSQGPKLFFINST